MPVRPSTTQPAARSARLSSQPAQPAPQLGTTSHSGPGAGVPTQPSTQLQKNNEALRARLSPSHPNYIGPGYAAFNEPDGSIRLGIVDAQLQAEWKAQQSRIQTQGAAQPSVPTIDDLNRALAPPAAPAAPLTIQQRFAASPGAGAGGYLTTPLAIQRPVVASGPTVAPRMFPTVPGAPGASQGPPTGATSDNPEAEGPAEIDRAKIDALLGNVSKATSGVFALADSENQFSQAQAQLALGLGQAQAQGLSLARSGNRRDAAANMSQALQRNSELGGEATRSSALLRAQEEDANRRLKLDAFKAAGDLGLNAGALELDAERIDMGAATNYLNQLFETNRLGMQLDEAEAARVTNFVRDMALIEKDYHALSIQEQAAIRDDLTRRYGINEQTKMGLEQLDRQGQVNWGQIGAQFLAGVGTGAAAGGMTLLSDRRQKTDVKDTTDEELEELLGSLRSQTYRYTGARGSKGAHLGFMAQDLRRTRLGASMVDETSDGTLVVDGGKVAGAAMSGLAKVYERLRALEEAL